MTSGLFTLNDTLIGNVISYPTFSNLLLSLMFIVLQLCFLKLNLTHSNLGHTHGLYIGKYLYLDNATFCEIFD